MSVMHLNELSSTLTLASDALSAACAAATSRHIVASKANKVDTTGRKRLLMSLLQRCRLVRTLRPHPSRTLSIVLAQTVRLGFFHPVRPTRRRGVGLSEFA